MMTQVKNWLTEEKMKVPEEHREENSSVEETFVLISPYQSLG